MAQLDHLIDVIMEANRDVDHPARRIADEYPANKDQDYINIDRTELNAMELTESDSNDILYIPNISFPSRISGSTGEIRVPRIGLC